MARPDDQLDRSKRPTGDSRSIASRAYVHLIIFLLEHYGGTSSSTGMEAANDRVPRATTYRPLLLGSVFDPIIVVGISAHCEHLVASTSLCASSCALFRLRRTLMDYYPCCVFSWAILCEIDRSGHRYPGDTHIRLCTSERGRLPRNCCHNFVTSNWRHWNTRSACSIKKN